MPFDMIS